MSPDTLRDPSTRRGGQPLPAQSIGSFDKKEGPHGGVAGPPWASVIRPGARPDASGSYAVRTLIALRVNPEY